MMNGPEKSDSVIVAGKPTNKAERSAAQLVEQRAGTKGNVGQLSTWGKPHVRERHWSDRETAYLSTIDSATPGLGLACAGSLVSRSSNWDAGYYERAAELAEVFPAGTRG